MQFCSLQLKFHKTYFKRLKVVFKKIANAPYLCGDKPEQMFNTSPF
jgi:hypothetical protein